jgi:hypothetical protein
VQIEKKQYRHIPPASAMRRAQVAREHAALFPTRLALARWTRGGDIPHVFAAENKPLRAAWFDHAQHALQSWFEDGGFHQVLPELRLCPLREGGDPNLVCPYPR